jgi:hypothetical protein
MITVILHFHNDIILHIIMVSRKLETGFDYYIYKEAAMDSRLMRAIDALERADNMAFASCFSEDGWYSDYCPSSNGGDNWFCYGSAGIEMFFGNRFALDLFSLSCPRQESESRASFFGAYDGPYVYAMFEIKEIGDDGLIRKAVVNPT